MKFQNGFLLFWAFVGLSLVSLAAWDKYENPKTYSVSHTQDGWQAELDTLRMFQNVVGYPLTREVSDQWQAAIIRMQQRIISQVQPQMMEEQRKEAAKKDSTSKKQK